MGVVCLLLRWVLCILGHESAKIGFTQHLHCPSIESYVDQCRTSLLRVSSSTQTLATAHSGSNYWMHSAFKRDADGPEITVYSVYCRSTFRQTSAGNIPDFILVCDSCLSCGHAMKRQHFGLIASLHKAVMKRDVLIGGIFHLLYLGQSCVLYRSRGHFSSSPSLITSFQSA